MLSDLEDQLKKKVACFTIIALVWLIQQLNMQWRSGGAQAGSIQRQHPGSKHLQGAQIWGARVACPATELAGGNPS